MTSDKRLAANRRNAALGGPKTAAGLEGCKLNALRHGLRSVQTVVPGEDPDEWEAHRQAVVADLRPEGAVEFALAEDVAVKLWRLGRVVRHEADLIANAQDEDEILRAHEKIHRRVVPGGPNRADIPTRADVEAAKRAADKAEGKVAELEAALRTLEGLGEMRDEDPIEDWSVYEPLKKDLRLADYQTDDLFDDEVEPFVARHVRAMLRKRGDVEEVTKSMAAHWRDAKTPELRDKADQARKTYLGLLRRYRAGLERRRRAAGLPGPDDLDRIQRYEAHLERGLHKALDRLRDLQEGRGAVPPRGTGRRPGRGPGGSWGASGGARGSVRQFCPHGSRGGPGGQRGGGGRVAER
jgi:hypothetical protein